MLRELQRDAVRHHPLFRAGVDEQQILLPVVEEAEVALRIAPPLPPCERPGLPAGIGICIGTTEGAGRGGSHLRDGAFEAAVGRARDDRGPRHDVAVGRHEAADAVERFGGDAAAMAQPACELAVVHRAAAEGGFGKAGLAAIFGDFLQQFLGIHDAAPVSLPDPRIAVQRTRRFARLCRLMPAFRCFRPAHTQSQDGRGFSLIGEHAGFIVDATNSWETGQPQMSPLG